MPNRTKDKTETLNLRVSPRLKTALRLAAEKEHRSMVNMVEYLVLNYCEQHQLLNIATGNGGEQQGSSAKP